ncbi:RNA polymerase sigma factor [Nannocystis bainbridge]|uniref:Sigma-70 family RNA polymerase sigma factor n=1 Tax=Nannocystis bainbridge TaxID=2995303 RepID=A0ABT5E3Q5_9BACT|nr:sigma-70 family RNA polymerase sigma factor [Nannocystis bainbridge]MDC0719949.1 sigma-70 family RNA polymerase sigma factor [Nannocystis bainbridge]
MLTLERELEATLVALLRVDRRRGEAALVAAVYRVALNHARALAPRIGLAADEAEEVVGEALLSAARSYQPDCGSRWTTWARWRLRDALRAQARQFGEGAAQPWWSRSEEDQARSRRIGPGAWGRRGRGRDGESRECEERLGGPPDRDARPLDERVEDQRRFEQVREAFSRLDPRTRQIVLWHAHGDTPSQMAPRLSLSRNWVMVLRAAGLRRLRAATGVR